ncbi:MAG TPA: S-methyl-5-thioribose-1-phosphate isomerase [Actinomycetota bacterium]
MAPIERRGDVLAILDQRRLPHEERWLECRTPAEVGEAIRSLAVRGAPILGIVAANALTLVAPSSRASNPSGLMEELEEAAAMLRATRPTAVNISWAVHRVLVAARSSAAFGIGEVRAAIELEAIAIEREDRAACDAIGAFGNELVPEGANVLTHCNTGMLCTGGIGTAQGVILAAHRAGKRIHVWVDETRPVWQGARLTAWELGRLGVPRTLVADGAAASLMRSGRVDLVVTGADRITADGSVANKIGTYGLAVLARHHDVPFFVAAPVSTIDLETATGAEVPIEERAPQELTTPLDTPVAEPDTPAANPAFDVTPPDLVSAIVTEHGVLRRPYASTLREAVGMRERRGA